MKSKCFTVFYLDGTSREFLALNWVQVARYADQCPRVDKEEVVSIMLGHMEPMPQQLKEDEIPFPPPSLAAE